MKLQHLLVCAGAAFALAERSFAQHVVGSAHAGARAAANPLSAPPCRAENVVPPQWHHAVPQSASACGGSVWPFSARFTPRGDRLYVPIFGGLIGNGGCAVRRLHPVTFATLAEIPTGESPQEVAFTTFADGSLKLGFVTNSSASSVTVFDANDNVVATIPIPFASGGGWPTAFPFGLVVSPDQTTVYVGTQDGAGWVHAIDTATLTLDPQRSIFLGADHGVGRCAFAGATLVLTVTHYLPGFTGAEAKLVCVDPQQPQVLNELVLGSSSSGFLFPGLQDCAVDCDGMVWTAGSDLGPWVFGIDPTTLTLKHVLPTNTSQPDGKFQALGLSPQGLLVVADFWTDEIAAFDARRRVWLSVTQLSGLPTFQSAAQELEFAPNRDVLVVPWAASDNIGVFVY
ncbi:MAG: hypothetical protein L6Q99_03280 [Planctomycetes bacterium]|nr:hypothetical protein [Planctomycetota bacterium]